MAPSRPHLTVVGLGPAGEDLMGRAAAGLLARPGRRFLRTRRHPAAAAVPDAESFDDLYESAATFDEVYAAIVERLVAAAADGTPVVYAVPGSPLVAEQTVEMLRRDGRCDLTVVPALSFLDLAWQRLGVDPVTTGVRLADASAFAEVAPGATGPLLVAQCWSRALLSDVKLSAPDEARPPRPVLLHHLGLADEAVLEVDWWELDRTLEPDHLTSLYVPALVAPATAAAGAEISRLAGLTARLRAECPWDRAQTHATLMPHLVEECYEVLDALAALPGAGEDADGDVFSHLEEELGDLLFQIVLHSRLTAERGRFDLAAVARGIHDKLVLRHPHVFGDAEATSADQVLSDWEARKKREKGRRSVTEGIPTSLPALMLANKLARQARALGVDPSSTATGFTERMEALAHRARDAHPDAAVAEADEVDRAVGELLFAVADLAQRLGVDAEHALRARALSLRAQIVAAESVPEEREANR